MQIIRRRVYLLAVFTGLGLLSSALFLLRKEGRFEIDNRVFLTITVLVTLILAGLLASRVKELKIARLIVENAILNLCTASTIELPSEGRRRQIQNSEVIVSYFGVLLNDRVIKFNQEGIRLRAMEIGPDHISFSYGLGQKVGVIRILRPPLDPATLEEISEKFRYETGVAPTLILKGK